MEDRKALVGELARAVQAPAAPAEPAKPAVLAGPEVKAAPSPDAARARREADELLERAQSAPEWTDRDVRALRALMPILSSEDRQAVTLSLVQAINAGRLALREDGPPF